MKKILLLTLAVVALLFFCSGRDDSLQTQTLYEEYEPVGCMHASLCVPEATRNFTENGIELTYVELTTGDAFVIEGTLEENTLYTLYRDDMGTPSMTDDKIVSAERLI